MQMQRSSKWLRLLVVLTFVLVPAITKAAKPDKPGGGNGGGGGEDQPYVVVELPAGENGVLTESISDVAPDGTFYVVGKANGSRATIWTIDADRSVVAEDLGDILYDNGLDVNSAGIVAGWQRDELSGDLTPVLLTPDSQVINLPGSESFVRIRINNPDELGIFQVVGSDLLWDVTVDGDVLGSTELVDSQGTYLDARDINDSEEITGFVVAGNQSVPVTAEIDAHGELAITPLVNPDPSSIEGFGDMLIDSAGNVLGDGWEQPNDPDLFGVFPRAVVWRITGETNDLGAESRTYNVIPGGIATVNGTMQCVGAYFDRDRIAFVYSNGGFFELQDVDSRWFEIDRAGDINSSGIICARGKFGKRRDYQRLGCLLIPVP